MDIEIWLLLKQQWLVPTRGVVRFVSTLNEADLLQSEGDTFGNTILALMLAGF